ncbi:hypothetical protein ACHAWO_006229 [Cyclotella atomus]|uniref:Nucleotide-diphospho-sugar transferase domain-containing protein n=1 Tax=Cyclotella atomus TaxID=382360 RepID=A0ABD3RB65_9STRA
MIAIRSSQCRIRLAIGAILAFYMVSLILNSYYLLTTTSSHQQTVQDAPCILHSANDDYHSSSSSNSLSHKNTRMLAVVSVCIAGPRFTPEYINASLSNKRLFCQRWGANSNNTNYHAKWEKLVYIDQTLHEENTDWVLWMDCDAAFTNLEVDWTTHVPLNKSKLMVASEDKNGINLGVFLVPNTFDSREFIHQMYEKRHYVERMKFQWKDQSALIELMKEDPTIVSRIEMYRNER